jgi:hypothetical protein
LAGLALGGKVELGEKACRDELLALLKEHPNHLEARLLLAWCEAMGKGGQGASLDRLRALSGELPAEPRIQWAWWKALDLAKAPEASKAKEVLDALLASEPGAAARVDEFRLLTEGQFRHPQRLLSLEAWYARQGIQPPQKPTGSKKPKK